MATVELLKFWTKDGLLMSGLLSRSQKRNTTVILDVFGMTSNFFSSLRREELYRAAYRTKIDVFSAENRGIGSVFPFTNKNGKRIFIGTANERFEDCLYDISGAIKILKSIGYKKIILLGHSTGCQKAVYYQYKTKDKSVKGIILLAPMDDYNLNRISLDKKLKKAISIAKIMVSKGKAHELTPTWISYYSAARFLSYALPNKAEAKIFNYDSTLKEFRSITRPVLVVIGSKEQNTTKSIKEYISILENATRSKHFSWAIIKGADHGFHSREKQLAEIIIKWADDLEMRKFQ